MVKEYRSYCDFCLHSIRLFIHATVQSVILEVESELSSHSDLCGLLLISSVYLVVCHNSHTSELVSDCAKI